MNEYHVQVHTWFTDALPSALTGSSQTTNNPRVSTAARAGSSDAPMAAEPG